MDTLLMYVIMCLVRRFKAPGGGFRNLKFDLLCQKNPDFRKNSLCSLIWLDFDSFEFAN